MTSYKPLGMIAIFKSAILLSILSVSFSATSALALSCSSEVSLNGAVIEIEPSGADDSQNFQCAFDEAIAAGVQTISLSDSSYKINNAVTVSGFEGRIAGFSSAKTTIEIGDGSFDCAAKDYVFGFFLGNVTVARASFKIADPCASDSGQISVFKYTSAANDCSKRTVFGNVDRVAMTAGGRSSKNVLRAVTAQNLKDCSDPILGTLKVNRSEFNGFDFGVVSALGGGGQVDVNYNEFRDLGNAVFIVDAFQSTTILANKFWFNGAAEDAGLNMSAVVVLMASSAAPAANSTVLSKNQFYDQGVNDGATAVIVSNKSKRSSQALVALGNTFDGGGSANYGFSGLDLDGGLMQGNVFKGSFNGALNVEQINFGSTTVSDWALVGNSFSAAASSSCDVCFSSGTSGSVVGAGQGAQVGDAGNNVDLGV